MADDPERLLQRYGYGDPRWLEPGDLTDSKLHPPAVNEFALPPKASAEVRNDSTRPDAYVDKNVREFMPPTVFAGAYGLGRTLGTAYGDLRMGDYAGAAHALPEIAMAVAPMPGAKGPKLRPRELDKLGYYSQALEAAKAWPMEKGTPEQALAYLKKAGTKDAEIKATALDKYLAEQDGVITRQGLEDYLRKNRVNVEADRYGGIEPEVDLNTLERNRLTEGRGYEHVLEESNTGKTFYLTEDKDAGNVYVQGPSGAFLPIDAPTNKQRYHDGTDAIKQYLNRQALPPDVKEFATYQEYSGDPLNKSYREDILRYAPQRLIDIEAKIGELENAHRAARQAGAFDEASRINAERQKLRQESYDVSRDLFDGGHFPGSGIISHNQNSVQTAANGERVLVPWQIQSDWGQRLRDNGAMDPKKLADLEAASTAAHDRWQEQNKRAMDFLRETLDAHEFNSDPNWMETLSKLPKNTNYPLEVRTAAQQRLNDLKSSYVERRRLESERDIARSAAPPHPLVNTTDQWSTTQLRRLLQIADEKGVSGLAIPSGETVLGYNPGDFHGMTTFYDKIIPKNMTKELKRLDPEHPGRKETQILAPDETELGIKAGPEGREILEHPFSYFELTPRVKEEIKKGLPLFSLGALTTADLLRRYYGEEQ
jgi:hypothetical protein